MNFNILKVALITGSTGGIGTNSMLIACTKGA